MADELILIIDDDKTSAQVLKKHLEGKNLRVEIANSPEEGLRQAYRLHPQLVLLDIMMPAMDGLEVCKRLRELSDVPIIFLTAKTEKETVIKGLELGADDYVTKPVDADILHARIRSQLRRMPKADTKDELLFDDGHLKINLMTREVFSSDEEVQLTPKEFSLLSVMAREAGRVITREDLVKKAWNDEYAESIDNLKLYIHYLRKKIETSPARPKYILTSRGVGYRFIER